MNDSEKSEFFDKISELGKIIHDDEIFKEIQAILAKFKNTMQRRNFLAPKMLQDVICFDKIREILWQSEIERDKKSLSISPR